jgi:hypothetical protein
VAVTLKRKVLRRDDFGICVLLPKTLWQMVPEPGRACTARVDGRRRRLRVETEHCTCRGNEPHEHRLLALPSAARLRPGDRAVIEL